MVVGSSALMVMPASRNSAAVVCTKEHRAAMDALNALHVTTGRIPALEPITVMFPPPRARIAGITERTMLTALRRFTSSSSSHALSLVFSTG